MDGSRAVVRSDSWPDMLFADPVDFGHTGGLMSARGKPPAPLDRLAVLERDVALVRERMPTRNDIAWGVFWGLLGFAILPFAIMVGFAIMAGVGMGLGG